MQQNLINEMDEVSRKIEYLVGSATTINEMRELAAKTPFDNEIIDFLNTLSKMLMKLPEAKMYPDVITLAFWMRKSSVMELREYCQKEQNTLWDESRRFVNPQKVYVDLSQKLWDLKKDLLEEISEKALD